MSCRSTSLGSAAITLCNVIAGDDLSEASVQSILHELRKHHRTVDEIAPHRNLLRHSTEQVVARYRRLAASQAGNLSETRQASVDRRLQEAGNIRSRQSAEWCSVDLLYALDNLPAMVSKRRERVQRVIQNFQSRTRQSPESIRQRLTEYEKEERLSRSHVLSDEQRTYGELNKLGSDAALIRACMRMEAETEALEVRRLRNAPSLVRRYTNVGGSRWNSDFGRIPTGIPGARIRSAGYDPNTRRLEVELTSGTVLAYKDVPSEIGRRVLTRDFVTSLWRLHLRGNPDYQYASAREAKLAGKAQRCLRCGQFAAADHMVICPSLPDWNRLPVQAAQPVVENARRTRERGENSSGVVLPSLTALRALPEGHHIFSQVTGNRASATAPWQTIGDVWVKKDAAGAYTVRGNRMTCSCGQPLPCEHVRQVLALTERRLAVASGATSETPRPRRARSFNMHTYRTSNNTNLRVDMGAGQDHQYLIMPSHAVLDRALEGGPVRFSNIACSERDWYRWDRRGRSGDTNYELDGSIAVEKLEDGTYTFTRDDLTCDCHQAKPCRHMLGVENAIRAYVSDSIPLLTEAQMRAESAAKANWANVEEKLAEAKRLHQEQADVSYTDNPDKFLQAAQSTTRTATGRRRRRVEPLPYRTENALGGYAQRGSGRGFGVEIEFEVKTNSYSEKRDALEKIAKELHEAGLTASSSQLSYRAAKRGGYKDTHVDNMGKGTWSFEEDGSVDGELVTPIMYDEPETWEKLATAVAIIKKHGGIPSKQSGAHVHVGTGDYQGDAAKYASLMRIMNQHEDVWYRLASDPARGSHRNNGYAAPLAVVPPSGFANIAAAKRKQAERYSAINFQSVSGDSKSHVEFRLFDATLDPGAMQSQVMLAVAATEAAARNSARDMHVTDRETSGFHKALSFTDPVEESASTRSLIDMLFVRKEDKEQIATLYGRTQWSEAIREDY